VAAVSREAVGSVDTALVERVGEASFSHARAALAALIDLGRSHPG
jgi:hypothetical protein